MKFLTEEFLIRNYFEKAKVIAGSLRLTYEDNKLYVVVSLFCDCGPSQKIYMENKENGKCIDFYYRTDWKLTEDDFKACISFVGAEDIFIYEEVK